MWTRFGEEEIHFDRFGFAGVNRRQGSLRLLIRRDCRDLGVQCEEQHDD
jgi:hypothetical protein